MKEKIDWKRVKKMTVLELAHYLNHALWDTTSAYSKTYHYDLEDMRGLSDILLGKIEETKDRKWERK